MGRETHIDKVEIERTERRTIQIEGRGKRKKDESYLDNNNEKEERKKRKEKKRERERKFTVKGVLSRAGFSPCLSLLD